MEMILTAILVTVILNTATGYREHRAQARPSPVGATVALLGLFASPISGAHEPRPHASDPTSCRGTSPDGGVYILVGPLAGAAIAVMVIGLVQGLPDKAEREAAEGGALPLER